MAAQDGSRSHLRWRSEVNEHGRDGQLVGARCVDAVASCARAAEAHQTGGWYGAGARACVVGTTDALGRARREGSWARHTFMQGPSRKFSCSTVTPCACGADRYSGHAACARGKVGRHVKTLSFVSETESRRASRREKEEVNDKTRG